MEKTKMVSIKKVTLMIVSILSWNFISAQNIDCKYASIYIYSFTKYIEWPTSPLQQSFTIGVFGNPELVQDLLGITTNKKVKEKSFSIKDISSLEEIENIQIIYVPIEKEGELPEILKIANKNHILIVSEGKNATKKGACISLITIDGKLKFELYEESAVKAGLKISNQLLPLAILVN